MQGRSERAIKTEMEKEKDIKYSKRKEKIKYHKLNKLSHERRRRRVLREH